jgi:hypothetical protein
MLGIAEALASGRLTPEQPPVLATLAGAGSLRAAWLRDPPRPGCLAAVDKAAVDRMVEGLVLRDRSCSGVVATPWAARRFSAGWQERTGARFALAMAQKLYELTELTAPTSAPAGRMRAAGAADHELVGSWMLDFAREAVPHEGRDLDSARAAAERRIRAGEIHLWDSAAEPVAMAGFSRPTATGITINSVYTPPERRRLGYASALVAAMSARALASGRRACFLYTDADNRTSNRIYQRIGYRWVCDSEFWSRTQA